MSQIRGSATILAILFATGIGVAKVWNPPAPKPFVPVGDGQLPRAVAGYVVAENVPSTVNERVRTALSSASIASHSYLPAQSGESATETPIEFILIGGTDRSALHDPRSCLIGSGWTIENDFSEPLRANGNSIPAHTCRIINTTMPGKPTFDIIYLYVVDGKVIESVTQIRAQMLMSAILGKKNTPIYFLRFIRQVDSDAAESNNAHVAMRAFAQGMWQKLSLLKKQPSL